MLTGTRSSILISSTLSCTHFLQPSIAALFFSPSSSPSPFATFQKTKLLPIAMHFAKEAAANALIDGWIGLGFTLLDD
jgi:hypothetical protein